MISLDRLTEEEVKAKLSPKSDIIKADEMKLTVVTLQNPGRGKSPFFVLVGQPQTINESSNFNDQVMKACVTLSDTDKRLYVISVAADGVGCDNSWVVKQLRLFLEGRQRCVGLVDTNHNRKNFLYQFIGASSAVCIGDIIFDTYLFRLAGVGHPLWRVKDFASDLLVLELASVGTIDKLYTLEGQSMDSLAVLIVTLYFLRMRLHAVNAKVLGYRERVCLIWCSIIWTTSLGYKSPLGTNQANMLANQRNTATETIRMSFS
jgi:hypothetical protein